MGTQEKPDPKRELRHRAEHAIERSAQASLDAADLPDGVKHLIHELRVYQAELEMQNEELLRVQHSLEYTRDLYSDLYEYSPVAYLNLNPDGLILGANQTTATWLDMPRDRLVNQPFNKYISPDDQDDFYLLMKRQMSQPQSSQSRDIRLIQANGKPFFVRLNSILRHDPEGNEQIRIALTDVTEHKKAEMELKAYREQLQHKVEDRTATLRLANDVLNEREEQLRLAAEMAGLGYWLWNLEANRIQWGGRYQELIHLDSKDNVSSFDAFLQAIHPDDRHQVWQTMNHLLEGNRAAVIDFQTIRAAGDVRWITARAQAFLDAGGRPLYVRGVMYDVTERKRIEQAEREQRLLAEALIDVVADLNSSHDLDEVLQQILRNLRAVIPHDAASILLLRDNKLRLTQFNADSNHPQDQATFQPIRLQDVPHLDVMLSDPRHVVVGSVEAGEYWIKSDLANRVRSYICAPILKDEQLLGIVNVESFTPEFFDEKAVNLVRAFVHHASLAIWNAYACMDQQELAVTEERQRIAMELHDAVSQTLWSTSIIAEALPDLWERDPGRAMDKTEMLGRMTRGTLAEMRALLLEIRPGALSNTPLDQSLERLVDASRSRTDQLIDFTAEGEEQLPPELRRVFYRVAQEAINNAARHAQANRIDVSLTCDQDEIVLTVHDEGIGFDVDRPPPLNHYGLSNIRERAKAVGAQVSIASSPNEGTTVRLRYAPDG